MNYAVIMGGGKGTRFWPVSTNKRPKQFLTLSGSRSMLRQTVDRLRPFVRSNNIYIIGNQRHYTITSRELKNIPKKNIIAEPVGRNTAPCLGLAS
ncbi:MAG: sugar phosphate nucleotidyltransferase, partial [Candidatus Omnitrophota bacterium]